MKTLSHVNNSRDGGIHPCESNADVKGKRRYFDFTLVIIVRNLTNLQRKQIMDIMIIQENKDASVLSAKRGHFSQLPNQTLKSA